MKTQTITRSAQEANRNGEFWFSRKRVNLEIDGDPDMEFRARIGSRRYTAYGRWSGPDDYAVEHGPTQEDVDVICALLDEGYEPDTAVED